jgi:hypothetical protein
MEQELRGDIMASDRLLRVRLTVAPNRLRGNPR